MDQLGEFFQLIESGKKEKPPTPKSLKKKEMKISLADLFAEAEAEKKRIKEQKEKEREEKKKITGEVSLDDLFSSLAEQKKRAKESEKKKKEQLEKLEREAKAFESFLFSDPIPTPKKEEVQDIKVETVTTVEEKKEEQKYVGELETRIKKLKTHTYKSIDRLMKSIAKKYEITPQVLHDDFKEKHGEIPDEWVKQFIEKEEEVQEEVDPNIQGALDVLDKLKRTDEEIEGEEDAEVRKLKREVEQLRKMVHEITRTAAAQGGGGEVRLEFLDDVDRDSAKVDGKVLQYDASAGIWTGGAGGEGSTRFADLSDVDLPETRRALIFEPSTSRVIGTDVGLSYSDLGVLSELAQALNSTFNDGDVLTYSSSEGKFIATSRASSGIRTTLVTLDDVDATGISTNDVLIFNGQDFEFTTPFEIVDRSDSVDDDTLDYGSF